jgi:hypothetical protein
MRTNNVKIAALAAALGALALSCTTVAPPEPESAKPVALEQAVTRAPSAAPAAPAAAEPDAFAGRDNLALGRPTRSNNHIYEFTAPKATDGEILTYFEGAANAYPDEIYVDLGGEKSIAALRVRLNPKMIWQARKQTLEVLVSADGTDYTQAVAPAAYQWDPATGNAVTIAFSAAAAFVKLAFTANEGSTGAQIAELEIYGE